MYKIVIIMDNQKLITELKQKGSIEDFALTVREQHLFYELFDIVNTEKSSVKYVCSKIIRFLSERNPQIIYPFYFQIASWLRVQNNFIKWDAIYILSNLAHIDNENKLKEIYVEYFDLIKKHQMVSAANVAGNSWKFVLANPKLDQDITLRLLDVPNLVYLHKNKISSECNNVVCGKVLESFDKYFTVSNHRRNMIEFAEKQLDSTRKSVAKSAFKFLEKYNQL